MKILPVLICVFALGACSGKPPEPQSRPAAVATPFDALKADEQRARDVEKVLQKQDEERRKQIDAEGQ